MSVASGSTTVQDVLEEPARLTLQREFGKDEIVSPRSVLFRRTTTWLILILVIAFSVRLAVRLWLSDGNFWEHGYTLFYELAQNFVDGKGLCFEHNGWKCAYRPPLYPLFLSVPVWAGKSFYLFVIMHAIVGTGTVLCAYLIGKELFNHATALVAAAMTAVYPYFVNHDTALQETSLFTFLTALTILLLLKTRKAQSNWAAVWAGLLMGSALLTRATLAPFVPLAFAWVLLYGGENKRMRLRRTFLLALVFCLTLAPWLWRNQKLFGSPVLTTLTGLTLWAGNNPLTFSAYPNQSIDVSVGASMGRDEPGRCSGIQSAVCRRG